MSGRAPRPVRRNVVVLFVDLVGSTELAERLDPELLRHVLDRYHRACTACITQHGGVVEKYIGDAVMAVFGVPAASEDDALRAARAARDVLARVEDLGAELASVIGSNLQVHCGIAAGEAVVVDVPGSDLRVIGDIVNTASRLQSAAQSGEILVGDDVARMIRAWARLEAVPPLKLKGKSSPVRAWRLLTLEAEPREEDHIPLIGRADELQRLQRAYRRVIRERRRRMVTLLGAPGIGKSRLVREFLRSLPEEATVLTGRCHSYGAGITYRPIVEMLRALDGARWAEASARIEPESVRTLRGLAAPAAVGTAEGEPGVEEISGAVRGLFDALARDRPLVLIWEDLHWAEPTLLDLIEDLAAWLVDVPVLLVCLARPELLDARPAWGAAAYAAVVELGPLDRAAMERLAAELAAYRIPAAEVVGQSADRMCRRVVDGSDGNPLFAELLLETLTEEGEDAPPPPTIQALLGARLDRLDDGERDVLERAATIGHVFTVDQLDILSPQAPGDRRRTGELIRRLVRHRMIRHGETPGSFQFAQTLTRDTVYAMTRKELRAAWHLALADRLCEQARTCGSGGASFDESAQGDLAHHLEAACHLKREVRPDDPLLPELTERAAQALIAQGTQALYRKDLPAAISLLERGRKLLPAGHAAHRPLALRVCDAGLARGERDRAFAALEVAERMLPGDQRNQLTCAIQRRTLDLRFGADPPHLEPLRNRLAADPGDDLSWCRFHQLEALVHQGEGRLGAAEAALRAALRRARSMRDRYEERRLLSGLCELAQWAPSPIRDGLALCAELSARFGTDRALLVPVLITQARLLALSGDIPAARDVLATADRYVSDLHLDLAGAAVAQVKGVVEALAGRHAEAETAFRRGAAALRTAGQPGPAMTLEVYAARELLRQGQPAAAGRAVERLRDAAGRLQSRAELVLLALRARLAAIRGDDASAASLAADAEERLDRTDDPCLRGDILVEIAEVHRAAGRAAQARAAAMGALRHYTVKGADLPAARVRQWLAVTEKDAG